MNNLHVYPDSSSMAEAAAERIVSLARQAVDQSTDFRIALSGGSTPEMLYRLLAAPPFADRIPWQGVHVFWGDERCVPPDHGDSCYHMARETLLDHVPLSPDQIHRIRGEAPPQEAALEYEELLRDIFGGEWPRFNLILLGMGDDGHTASLFPGTKALHEEKRWVVENYVDVKQMWRVTLTRPAINAAANVMFLVSGEGKASRLREVLQGEYAPFRLPAQMIKPENGTLLWLVDQATASLLK